jgi:hypothetical protein
MMKFRIPYTCNTDNRSHCWKHGLISLANLDSAEIDDLEGEEPISIQEPMTYEVSAPVGKVVFVFTDVENSTEKWEANARAMQEALALHNSVIRDKMHLYL